MLTQDTKASELQSGRRGAPAYTTVRWAYPVCVSAPLIVLNCGWIANSEIRNNLTEGTVSTLFMGVLFILFLITLLNLLVRRIAGARAAMNQSELMVVYIMLSMSSAIAGVSNVGFLALSLGAPTWYARNNPGASDYLRLLPACVGPRSWSVLSGFYNGHSSFFVPATMAAWAFPLLFWGAFLMVLLWTTFCLSAIVRGRYADEEHLAFPVIALPLEMTKDGGPVYRNYLLWIGFAIPLFLHSLNTLNGFYPGVPSFRITSAHELNDGLQPPWSGIDSMLLLLHPVGVGFGYLIGTDVSFSLWFFYLLKKALCVAGVAFGWRDPHPGDWGADSALQFPFTAYQGWGAWIWLGLTGLGLGKGYLVDYIRKGVRGERGHASGREAMSPRTAIVGVAAGFICLCAVVWLMGGSLWLPVLIFLAYLLIMVAICRLRAETAVLSTGLGVIVPQAMLPLLLGTRGISDTDLTHMSTLSWFNIDYRSVAMPQQLEALVALGRTRAKLSPMLAVVMIASVISIVAAMLWTLQMYYVNGAATANVVSWRNEATANVWNQLEHSLHNKSGPNSSCIIAAAAGFGIAWLLAALRARFLGFPLHPAAYVMNMSPVNDYFWLDMFVAWLLKSMILRYGGLRLYQKALPFFFGLILGDFVTGSAWCIVGTTLHVNLFRTFPV